MWMWALKCHGVHVKGRNNSWKSVLSCHFGGSEDWTQSSGFWASISTFWTTLPTLFCFLFHLCVCIHVGTCACACMLEIENSLMHARQAFFHRVLSPASSYNFYKYLLKIGNLILRKSKFRLGGKMAQWFRALGALPLDLPEDQSSVPSTYIRCLPTACNSSSRGALLASSSTCTNMAYKYTNTIN